MLDMVLTVSSSLRDQPQAFSSSIVFANIS